ncbi:MAG TPA: hypothetical protein VGB68_05935 [Pyrinomonadaceae bacterium]|jgi:hypothetical protein
MPPEAVFKLRNCYSPANPGAKASSAEIPVDVPDSNEAYKKRLDSGSEVEPFFI